MGWVLVFVLLRAWAPAWADDDDSAEPPAIEPDTAVDSPAEKSASPPEFGPSHDLLLLRPSLQYPKHAQRAGVQGTVSLRLLIEVDGSFVPRSDPACRWSGLSRKERFEAYFDQQWCVEVISGPALLRYETLKSWVRGAEFLPYLNEAGVPSRYVSRYDIVYKLR